jgi:cation transporter-like permease
VERIMENTITVLYSSAVLDVINTSNGYIFANFLANLIETGLLLAILYIVRGQKGNSSSPGVGK